MKDKALLLIWILLFIGVSFFTYTSFFKVSYAQNSKSSDSFLGQNLENSLSQKTYLFDPGTDEGFGIAKRVFSEGIFLYTISANLRTLPQGEQYFTWLSYGKQNSVGEEYIQTGKMTLLDGEYFVFFESRKDLSDHPHVLINRDSGLPTKNIVLEGYFNDLDE